MYLPGTASRFNDISVLKIGGNEDVSGKIIDAFNGIIAGKKILKI